MSSLFTITINTLLVLIIFVPLLLGVAFITVGERKGMASMQRRLGPNYVGYYGLLQAFADAIKLVLKETIIPIHSNKVLFVLGPIITLVFSLLGWCVIPLNNGITMYDYNYGILYSIAISSIAVYGILIAGWSANSKYAFIGSLRSTAQLISYELVLTTIVFIVIMLVSNLNMTEIVESQRAVWYVVPLLPLLVIFYIASVAETNRPPFDLVEAESELVSGHMTELSASPFVLFFLSEYSNIMLICCLNIILFLGGYLNFDLFTNLFSVNLLSNSISLIIIEGLIYGASLGIKANILMFTFIWVRAAFPRIRYDQLINFCWVVLLPLLFGIVILVPCIFAGFDSLPLTI